MLLHLRNKCVPHIHDLKCLTQHPYCQYGQTLLWLCKKGGNSVMHGLQGWNNVPASTMSGSCRLHMASFVTIAQGKWKLTM